MDHLGIRRELAGRLDELLKNPSVLPITLWLFQTGSLGAMQRWLEDPAGTRRAHIAHATGLGKTVLFAAVAQVCTGLRMLVVVPTKTLLEQTARVVASFTGGMVGHVSSLGQITNDDGEVIAVRGHDYHDVVITTYASFHKHAMMFARDFRPDILIHDECHWAYAEGRPQELEHFPEAVIMGFSATPDYLGTVAKGGYTPVTLENGLVLYGPRDRFAETHFGIRLDERGVRWGIENGYLAPLAWGRIEFDVSLKDLPTQETAVGTDYDPSALRSLMTQHWSVMVETVRRLYVNGEYDLPNKQAFAVCDSVTAAEELAEAIASTGISSACVTGETPDKERDRILRSYRANGIRFLSSVMVLREGWDAPNAEVCMMLRPTKSRVLYQQCMGRVLRLDPDQGYKVALVLDAHFQNTTFAPLSAAALIAPPGSEIELGAIMCGWGGEGGRARPKTSPYLPSDAVPRLVVVDALGEEYTPLPFADADHVLRHEGAEWMTIGGFAALHQLSHRSVDQRVQNAPNLRRQKAHAQGGKIREFYLLEDLRRLCHQLLGGVPITDQDGKVVIDGLVWLTATGVEKMFRLQSKQVVERIRISTLTTREVLDHQRRSTVGYLETELRQSFHDLLESRAWVSQTGIFTINEERWGTILAISEMLGYSHSFVLQKISSHAVPVREFRAAGGRVRKFYKVDPILALFPNRDQDLPRAGENGSFEKDGEVWVCLTVAVEMLNLTESAIIKRCLRQPVRVLQGRSSRNRLVDYYALSDLRRVCADLIETLPQLDATGIVTIGDTKWGTLSALESVTQVSYMTLRTRVIEKGCRSLPAKDPCGRRVLIYEVNEVKAACADFIEATSRQLDSDSRCVFDGEEWVTVQGARNLWNISASAVTDRLRRRPIQHLLARDTAGRLVKIYRLRELQATLATLLASREADPP